MSPTRLLQGRSHPRLRINILRAVVFAVLAVLLLRLFSLQILEHDHYQVAAEGNRERTVVSPAPRGIIVDDKGVPFATNQTSLVITVDRSVLARQSDGGKALLVRLAAALHRSYTELYDKTRLCTAKVGQPCWNGSPYQPIPVLTNVQPQQALAIIEHPERFPGVSADTQAVREYPQGTVAAHEIGYTGPVSQAQLADKKAGYLPTDVVGQAGIEASYDQQLRGSSGVKTLAVDRFGNVSGVLSQTPAKAGDNVVLSLDSGVQNLLEQSLTNELAAARSQGKAATTGSGVVMNWHTGQVVAMASVPTYNPSVFTGGISQKDYNALTSASSGDPLISRAYQGTLAPGSTFKPVSLAAAVASGNDINGIYSCPSAIQIGNAIFHNFEGESGGNISLHEAIVMSCDTVFDQFAYNDWLADGGLRNGSGPYAPAKQYFTTMAKAFGFGRDTGIDLPAESSGWVTDRAALTKQYNEMKATYCKRAQSGYPEDPDPQHAALLQQYAKEACQDGNLYNGGAAVMFGIGQGAYLSVSPLQMATAYAAVANGGTVFHPRVAKALVSQDGKVTKIPSSVASHLPVAASTLQYIRDSMQDVTRRGTAAGAFTGFPLDQIPIAGKTGTAEVDGHDDTSWFASFSDQYVVVISIPNTGQGANYAAPVARQVYEGLYGVGRPALLPVPPTTVPKVAVTAP
jgi:penicillin-binding protein 2